MRLVLTTFAIFESSIYVSPDMWLKGSLAQADLSGSVVNTYGWLAIKFGHFLIRGYAYAHGVMRGGNIGILKDQTL